MAIKAVIGFVISAGVLVILGGIGLAGWNAARGRKTRPGIILIVVGFLIVLILGPLNAGLVLIQPNERGVVFRQTATGDAALRQPLDPGLHWVIPFVDDVIEYDVGQRSVTMAGAEEGEFVPQGLGTGPVRAISSDGQEITVDVTIIYRVNASQVNEIHRNWRNGFETEFIVAQARSEVRNAISEFGAEEIYSGGRATLESLIFDALQAKYQREGFTLSDVLVRNIGFGQEFTNAIEQKQIADQEAQRAAFRVAQAAQEAEQARVEAQGHADAVVIAAEGEAQSIVLRAEAEAQALQLVSEVLSLNPSLIQYEYINELGDNIEMIVIPSNSPFLFDLDSLLSQAGFSSSTTPAPSVPDTSQDDSGDN